MIKILKKTKTKLTCLIKIIKKMIIWFTFNFILNQNHKKLIMCTINLMILIVKKWVWWGYTNFSNFHIFGCYWMQKITITSPHKKL